MSTSRSIERIHRRAQTGKSLVVGIGSPHGDDQAGWKVIERLAGLALPHIELHQAKVPHDLFDWLDDVAVLHILDSCTARFADSNSPASESCQPSSIVFSYSTNGVLSADYAMLTAAANVDFRSASSHHIDVITVLELAACLNRLPSDVLIWAIPGEHFGPGDWLTIGCTRAIEQCVASLSKELSHA